MQIKGICSSVIIEWKTGVSREPLGQGQQSRCFQLYFEGEIVILFTTGLREKGTIATLRSLVQDEINASEVSRSDYNTHVSIVVRFGVWTVSRGL